jgi:HEPN domain-containing protein
MTPRDHAKEWIDYSLADLEAARFLFGMRPARLEIICYHCQQSAEKSMKAIIADFDHIIPRTHNLVDLTKVVSELSELPDFVKTDLRSLNGFDSRFRYPRHPELVESVAREALAAAERVLSAVKTILG